MAKIDSQKLKHEQIQYIEFLSKDIIQAKDFYTQCFGCKFTEYSAFTGGYIDGGFPYGEPVNGTILVILYTDATKSKLLNAGGTVTIDIFSFPGGKRSQFEDLDGYKLAVWTE